MEIRRVFFHFRCHFDQSLVVQSHEIPSSSSEKKKENVQCTDGGSAVDENINE